MQTITLKIKDSVGDEFLRLLNHYFSNSLH